jgi:hypothetical protein
LARANSAHADRLLRAQSDARLTTRELRQWFAHYQKVRRSVRERTLDHPRLFLQALNESAEQKSSERLRVGSHSSDRDHLFQTDCRPGSRPVAYQ